jgi:trk system potassium uptake protein TrkA
MRYHLSLCQGALELCIIKIRASAQVIGKPFASGIYNHGKYRIVAIKRGQETLIPRGQDCVEEGDLVYCVCPNENMEFMREELGKSKREIKNVIFFGGGRIARKAATELAEEMSIKVIEKDRQLCTLFSEKVPNALIINGDGSDMNVLREEGIEDADAFVAVTESSEANIFACLAAKRFGVRKTIAEIENIDYIPMAEGLEIGTVLNKKTIAASYIYQMLLDSTVRGVHNLTNADAEIMEFYAKEGSLVTKNKVKDLDLPTDANIGGIVRAEEGILVNGDTQIIAGDLVVIFCKNHVIRKLERFFK